MKNLVRSFIFACIVFIVFSCNTGVQESLIEEDKSNLSSENSDLNSGDDGKQVTWNVSEESFIYELPHSVETLHINVGKYDEVYFLKTNPSLSAIPKSEVGYVLSVDGIRQTNNLNGNLLSINQPTENLDNQFIFTDYSSSKDFVRPQLPLPTTRSSTFEEKDYSYLTKEAEVGEKRELYTENESTKEWATLHHTGTHCNVWVVDEDFTDGEVNVSGSKVNLESAKALGDSFDKAYPIVQSIFGAEQDYILNRKAEKLPINNKVNIVVYDIDNPRMGGFFWGKDFYTKDICSYSNEGKFFYIDSPLVCKNLSDAFSCLVHEFQHMINFTQKPESETWFNEMLSMLCEEILQSHLEIDDKSSPRHRLSLFCKNYYVGGLTTWFDIDSDHSLVSYARSYAFGAFLIRNYGGVNLLREIATNSSSNQKSIEDALKSLGINKTFNQVFEEFVFACTFPHIVENFPTFSKLINQTVNGYEFVLPSINLMMYNMIPIKIPGQSITIDGEKMDILVPYSGISFLPIGIEHQMDMYPYAFSLHRVGYPEEAGKLTLKFSPSTTSKGKNYVMVKNNPPPPIPLME